MTTNTQQILAEFVSMELLQIDDTVDVDENLLASGMVNSLGMLRLVGFIEEKFGVVVPPGDFTIANFSTIGMLAEYLKTTHGLESSD